MYPNTSYGILRSSAVQGDRYLHAELGVDLWMLNGTTERLPIRLNESALKHAPQVFGGRCMQQLSEHLVRRKRLVCLERYLRSCGLFFWMLNGTDGDTITPDKSALFFTSFGALYGSYLSTSRGEKPSSLGDIYLQIQELFSLQILKGTDRESISTFCSRKALYDLIRCSRRRVLFFKYQRG